ncbi:MAG: hypothetical protein CL678_00980 [Bdellovibrionaceae bacterium]|nr:hypothetical protein [Pseudobdellovibrionaceae bacterium]|tara:strand:- start:1961 stop:2215 length:255 start_codon:yes stop_codon:yes gene_type:complete
METVTALLGEVPSAAEAADIDSIAHIWVLIAQTIRDVGNGIESNLRNAVAHRTDRPAVSAIVATQHVYPAYGLNNNGLQKWETH